MSDVIQYSRVPGDDTLPSNCDLPGQKYDIHQQYHPDTEILGEHRILKNLFGASPCSSKWEHVACDLCGNDDPALWLEKDGFHYVRCLRCGLVYVTPRLRDHLQQQDKFYQVVTEGNLEAAAERDRNPRRMKSLIQIARSYLPYKHTGALLDVGCGFGAFLEAAASVGWRVCGLEVASAPASIAGRRHDVFYGSLSDAPYEPNSFDVVRLNNVIEHVLSPRALVCDIRRVLRSGGLLAISTPNIESFTATLQGVGWRYVQGGHHIYLFGLRTIGRLLETEGFKILWISTPGIRLIDKNGSRETRHFFLRKPTGQAVKWAERTLDLAARIALRGHRLRIRAEKAA
jgi:2-polyprenyl-3-methyl-5-hydroxy-6-metoxy-1,4-benzoquinol methylase